MLELDCGLMTTVCHYQVSLASGKDSMHTAGAKTRKGKRRNFGVGVRFPHEDSVGVLNTHTCAGLAI